MFSEKPNICCVSLDWTLTFVILVIFLVGNFGLDLEFALSHSKFIFGSSIDQNIGDMQMSWDPRVPLRLLFDYVRRVHQVVKDPSSKAFGGSGVQRLQRVLLNLGF